MKNVKHGSTKLEFRLMGTIDAIILLGQYRRRPKTVVRLIVYVHPDDTGVVYEHGDTEDD